MTPHVLRHGFASIANDLGFTEVTIAALAGHAKRSVTSKYNYPILLYLRQWFVFGATAIVLGSLLYVLDVSSLNGFGADRYDQLG